MICDCIRGKPTSQENILPHISGSGSSAYEMKKKEWRVSGRQSVGLASKLDGGIFT